MRRTIPQGALASAIYQATRETLEGTVFLTIAKAEAAPPQYDATAALWAQVDVENPVTGSLTLLCAPELLRQMTTFLHGDLEEEFVEEKMMDVLKEMVNTLTGRCMNILMPGAKDFSIGLPSSGRGRPKRGSGTWHHYCTDNGLHLSVMSSL